MSRTAHIHKAPPWAEAVRTGISRRPKFRSAARRAESAAFAAVARALQWRGRDVTSDVERASALVLAPHPDDETLGCGATIMRKVAAGQRVGVVVATDGRYSHRSATLTPAQLAARRREETVRACGALGLSREQISFLEYEDGRLVDDAEEASQRLLRIIDDFEPQEIYIPCRIDRHPDHRALHDIVSGLARSGRIRATILQYPVWFFAAASWVDPGPAAVIAPIRIMQALLNLRPVLVRTAGHLDRKAAALAFHQTQATGITGEPDSPRLDPNFLRHFFREYEMFFVLRPPTAPDAAHLPRARDA